MVSLYQGKSLVHLHSGSLNIRVIWLPGIRIRLVNHYVSIYRGLIWRRFVCFSVILGFAKLTHVDFSIKKISILFLQRQRARITTLNLRIGAQVFIWAFSLYNAVQLCCVMETNYELDLRFFREKKQKTSRKRAVEPKTLKVLKPWSL